MKKLLRFVAFTDGQCVLTTSSVGLIKKTLDPARIALIRNATHADHAHFTAQGIAIPAGRVTRAQDHGTTRKFSK